MSSQRRENSTIDASVCGGNSCLSRLLHSSMNLYTVARSFAKLESQKICSPWSFPLDQSLLFSSASNTKCTATTNQNSIILSMLQCMYLIYLVASFYAHCYKCYFPLKSMLHSTCYIKLAEQHYLLLPKMCQIHYKGVNCTFNPNSYVFMLLLLHVL